MDQIINEIVKILKILFLDKPIIALAGAHAKGVADKDSDLDIFAFTNAPKSYSYRKKIIENFCDDSNHCYLSENFDSPWGGSIDFTYKTILVETVVRSISKTEQIISQCIDGKFDIIPQTWTSNGYYSFIYLSEINFLKPICDDEHWLANNKLKIEKYPPKLKHNIISLFLSRAGTWIGNFHYYSAIKRQDIMFIAPIIIHTLMDFFQVIFAINETYFTGDKKLELMLSKLPYCPKQLLENIDFLFAIKKDRKLLMKQADILTDVYYELIHYTK